MSVCLMSFRGIELLTLVWRARTPITILWIDVILCYLNIIYICCTPRTFFVILKLPFIYICEFFFFLYLAGFEHYPRRIFAWCCTVLPAHACRTHFKFIIRMNSLVLKGMGQKKGRKPWKSIFHFNAQYIIR